MKNIGKEDEYSFAAATNHNELNAAPQSKSAQGGIMKGFSCLSKTIT